MQTWAQWLVIGEVMLLLLWLLNLLRKIICNLIWIALAMLLTLSAFYLVTNYNQGLFYTIEKTAISKGYVTEA